MEPNVHSFQIPIFFGLDPKKAVTDVAPAAG
jgi:hypothetical protein